MKGKRKEIHIGEEALLDPFSVSSPILFSTGKKDKVETCQSDMLDYKIPLKQKGRIQNVWIKISDCD